MCSLGKNFPPTLVLCNLSHENAPGLYGIKSNLKAFRRKCLMGRRYIKTCNNLKNATYNNAILPPKIGSIHQIYSKYKLFSLDLD